LADFLVSCDLADFGPMTFRLAKRIRPFHSGILSDVLQKMNSCNFRGRLFWLIDYESAGLILPNFQDQKHFAPGRFS
jgi:hypothetical protein